MMIGAILAGASKEEVLAIEKIAYHIGLAFQIQDDILDVISTTEILGKPVHSDEKNEKLTYVSLFGLDYAKNAVKEHSEISLAEFDALHYKNEFLRDLIVSLIYREK